MVWKRERIEQASSSGFAEALQHWTVWVGKTLASLMIITILIIYYYSDLFIDLFICYIDFYTCTAWDVSHKKCWALVVLTCLSHSCVKSELYVLVLARWAFRLHEHITDFRHRLLHPCLCLFFHSLCGLCISFRTSQFSGNVFKSGWCRAYVTHLYIYWHARKHVKVLVVFQLQH